MKVINIMIGLPGCGKSTFCQKIQEEWNGVDYVSRDIIRLSKLEEGASFFSQETNVYNEFVATINELMKKEAYEIYIDATHINGSSRLKLLRRLNLTGEEEICYFFFDTPIEECMRRNRKREGVARVPDSAIRDMSGRAQFFVTEAERRAYDPTEFHVDFRGEIVE